MAVIPEELAFLREIYPDEKLRQKIEEIRDGIDLHSNFFRLAKHWEYEAESLRGPEAEVFLRCAKQLKQRATWLTENVELLQHVIKAAPHLLPR